MDTQKFKPFISDDYEFSLDQEQILMALRALETHFAMKGYPDLDHVSVMAFLSAYSLKWGEDFLGEDFDPAMLVDASPNTSIAPDVSISLH